MEKPPRRMSPVVCCAVILLGAVAFSCSLAAEFKTPKAKDMKVDGGLCHLPRSPAFGLGIAALVCLSVAQIAGTTVAASRLCMGSDKSRRSRILPIVLLVLSWVSFALAAILLGTASSMSNRQPYGRGWMNHECYLVKDGIFIGSAILSATTAIFIIGFMVTATTRRMQHQRTSPSDEERNQSSSSDKSSNAVLISAR